MSLGLQLKGTLQSKNRLKIAPSPKRLFTMLAKELRFLSIPLLQPLMKVEQGSQRLAIHLYPSEAPLEFEYSRNQSIFCKVRTNGAGPGYHKYVLDLLEQCGKRIGITWSSDNEKDIPIDDTGYYQTRQFKNLQFEMVQWLKLTATVISEKVNHGSKIALSMPAGFSLAEDYQIISPLGFWEREWFIKSANLNEEELLEHGEEFFPWWQEEQNALFWLKTALVLLWVDCPWHPPVDQSERDLYRVIDACLHQAYTLDQTLNFPWQEWRSILDFLGDHLLIRRLDSIIPKVIENNDIGFKKLLIRQSFTGHWKLNLPGYFYSKNESKGATVVYWFADKTVRGSSGSMKNPDQSIPSATELFQRFEATFNPHDWQEVVEIKKAKILGKAGITWVDEKDDRYWMLNGFAAVDGCYTVITICFQNEADKDWAINTWKTVDYDSC